MADDVWQGTRREINPPRPVTVNVAWMLPPSRVGVGAVPLRVRAGGIDLAATVPGTLHTWFQTNAGDWWGEVELTLTNRTGHGQLAVRQLVSAAALEPR